MVVTGPEAKFDQGARVGDRLVLPAIIGLEAAQGVFGGGIPLPCGLAIQVVLANEGFLDLVSAFAIDLLLAFYFLGVLSFA